MDTLINKMRLLVGLLLLADRIVLSVPSLAAHPATVVNRREAAARKVEFV